MKKLIFLHGDLKIFLFKYFCAGLTKDSQILTFPEPYVTQANDVTLSIVNKDPELSVTNLTNLEVSDLSYIVNKFFCVYIGKI